MKDYQQHTDKYFLRSKLILQKENINPLVRYQVFVRKDIDCLMGIDKAVAFVKEHAPEAKVYSLKDGQYCAANEPIMKIEGKVQDLIDLETVYLGHISGGLTGPLKSSTIYHNAYGIVKAAHEKPVIYFGARHFGPENDLMITSICKEAGFVGCSTDCGAKNWDSYGVGTVPHALILAVFADMLEKGNGCNPSVITAELFDRHIEKIHSRVMLIDTFNTEISDTIDCMKQLGDKVQGVRIDTCGENISEGSDIAYQFMPSTLLNQKYSYGNGVTISAVWALRLALLKNGLKKTITVSSGFNPEKTAAFYEADAIFQYMYNTPLFDNIGTGSMYPSVIMATSDIVAYYSEEDKKWLEHHKVGRGENPSKRLKLV
jgi:nicotinate phosphoribosyltransferase